MKPLVTFSKRTRTSRPSPAGQPLRGDTRKSPPPTTNHPPRVAWTLDGRPAPLHNHYRGQHVWLVCGGPSLKNLDLSLLDGRGTICCLNNSWFMRKPDLWVCADPPNKFWDGGWMDPTIMKFVPRFHQRSTLRNGTPIPSCPNTFFYVRNNGFNPETFLTEDGVSWGTLKNTPDVLGIANSRSVMLAAFKILPWLGFTTINLLGCDFHMPVSREAPAYAWAQEKDGRGRKGNNNLYRILTTRFAALKPVLDGRGIQVFNCNPRSQLEVFPKITYEEALGRHPPMAEPSQMGGWY